MNSPRPYTPLSFIHNYDQLSIEEKEMMWYGALMYCERKEHFSREYWLDEVLENPHRIVFEDEHIVITIAYGRDYMLTFKRNGEEYGGTLDEIFDDDWYDFKGNMGFDTGCDYLGDYIRKCGYPVTTDFWHGHSDDYMDGKSDLNNVQAAIKQLVSNYYEERQSFYESQDVSRAEIVNYYSYAAEFFFKRGMSKEDIVTTISKGLGNYLLGKKYGVSPWQYVRNCLRI